VITLAISGSHANQTFHGSCDAFSSELVGFSAYCHGAAAHGQYKGRAHWVSAAVQLPLASGNQLLQ
jgi:hypothetical protein